MPHIPDLRTHADHDPELVAAYAAGDAGGAELEIATALVAGCAACATLHHDLRAIAAALPELPAPVRRRDFRLTPEQAASLRPAGWRGVLATLAGPRFRFAAPLGTALATLGLAGILVGSLAGVPLGVGGAATAEMASDAAGRLNRAPEAPAAGTPTVAPGAAYDGSVDAGGSQAGPVPAPTFGPMASPVPAASQNPAAGGAQPTAGGEAFAAPSPNVDQVASPGAQGTGAKSPHMDTLAADNGWPAGAALVVVGVLAVLAGLALVGIRLASRRLAR